MHLYAVYIFYVIFIVIELIIGWQKYNNFNGVQTIEIIDNQLRKFSISLKKALGFSACNQWPEFGIVFIEKLLN